MSSLTLLPSKTLIFSLLLSQRIFDELSYTQCRLNRVLFGIGQSYIFRLLSMMNFIHSCFFQCPHNTLQYASIIFISRSTKIRNTLAEIRFLLWWILMSPAEHARLYESSRYGQAEGAGILGLASFLEDRLPSKTK